MSSKSFPVLGNVRCWHWHVFWFGKTNLGALDTKLSLSGLGQRGRQEAEPAWAGGEPGLGEPLSACPVCSGWLELLSCEHRQSGALCWEKAKIVKQILEGASQDLCVRKLLRWGLFQWCDRKGALLFSQQTAFLQMNSQFIQGVFPPNRNEEGSDSFLWSFQHNWNVHIVQWHFCEWNFLKKNWFFFVLT